MTLLKVILFQLASVYPSEKPLLKVVTYSHHRYHLAQEQRALSWLGLLISVESEWKRQDGACSSFKSCQRERMLTYAGTRRPFVRKRAIGLMSKTHRDAQMALVLDSGIRSCFVSAPREEKLLRMLSSDWMQ
ncbi:hypothetical protein BKA83DRAFT_1018703 [Pisolithus microcarpus]|nr:hypothetical protein BKA83DRAFT_1018703 [Pisolithus microcarpus]